MKKKTDKKAKTTKKTVSAKEPKLKKVKFECEFNLGTDSVPVTFPFEVETEDETTLTWDEVEDSAYMKFEQLYEQDDFPNGSVKSISIVKKDGRYPVVPEGTEKKDVPKCEKYLVLPLATYSLAPEYVLYTEMVASGLIPETTEYDYDEMHRILESVDKSR